MMTFLYSTVTALVGIVTERDKGLYLLVFPGLDGSNLYRNSFWPGRCCLNSARRMGISCDMNMACNLLEFLLH